jgi:hypothetical protein
MNRYRVGLFLLVFLGLSVAHACGPFFPDSYIVYGHRSVLDLPALSLHEEIQQILSLPAEPPAQPFASYEAMQIAQKNAVRAPVQRTAEVDIKEFETALKEHGMGEAEVKKLVSEYSDLRNILTVPALAAAEAAANVRSNPYGYGYGKDTNAEKPRQLDMSAYEALLARIPSEFAEYNRGATAYYNGEMDAAVAHWQKVLALPVEQRKHRTLWAAFMLGRVLSDKDPAAAADYSAQSRAVVAEGALDPLKLSDDSLGWQARAEMRAKRYVDAIHHYAEFARVPGRKETAILSLTRVCKAVLGADTIDPALAKDELSCRIVAAALACRSNGAAKWADAIQSAQLQPPIRGADRLAWNAYQRGDMATAADWLKKADMTSVYARWVQAKLLLRDGRIEEGAAALANLDYALAENAVHPPVETSEPFATEKADERVLGDLGLLHLHEREYAQALETFARSGYYFDDALYVAECVMTMDELKAFVKDHMKDTTLMNRSNFPGFFGSFTRLARLEHVLASRLADQGMWNDAVSFFPEDLRADAKLMAELTEHAASATGRERAEALIKAAKLLREKGMVLTGRELMPDWRIVGGSFDLSRDGHACAGWLSRGEDLRGAGEEEKARVAKSLAEPNKRFHYRYKAADLMWDAASLLPNNDPLTAEALYWGGMFIKIRDPKAADRFYKALVRRNPNLEVAQQANKLRWFPAKFTDKVVYHPLSFWSRRKIAAAACVGAVCVIAVVFLGWLLLSRKAAAGAVSP